MIVGYRQLFKLSAVTVIAFCAVFVCALFLNYSADLTAVSHAVVGEQAKIMYDAQKMTVKVVVGLSGGCLAATSAALLAFYVKHYIDSHGAQLGILKALGCPNLKIACSFWVFGLSVLIGCLLGYAGAFATMPTFYRVQNAERLLPEIPVRFHFSVLCFTVLLPSICFSAFSVCYALFRLRGDVVWLWKGREKERKPPRSRDNDLGFMRGLKRSNLANKKTLVFFIAFSAFCFSAMTQMSLSMRDLASELMGAIIMAIGITLAAVMLLLSLTTVVASNGKTVAMMKAFGYTRRECAGAAFNVYRPVSYVGFILGTVYQWALLKLMVTVVFQDLSAELTYAFDWTNCAVVLAVFVVAYELTVGLYALKISRTPVKMVMGEE